MPIRIETAPLYPPAAEWREIRKRILARAGNACECDALCGLAHVGGRCLAPNGLRLVRRTRVDGLTAWSLDAAGVLVVLTIAHVDHDPSHNDDGNLRALCQRCHLRLDRDQHKRNAAATRARKKDARSGQRGLFK